MAISSNSVPEYVTETEDQSSTHILSLLEAATSTVNDLVQQLDNDLEDTRAKLAASEIILDKHEVRECSYYGQEAAPTSDASQGERTEETACSLWRTGILLFAAVAGSAVGGLILARKLKK